MKTHKNPELRASSVVKAGDLPAKKQTKPATTAPAVKKNPVFALQGKKWIVVSLHLMSAALFIVESGHWAEGVPSWNNSLLPFEVAQSTQVLWFEGGIEERPSVVVWVRRPQKWILSEFVYTNYLTWIE